MLSTSQEIKGALDLSRMLQDARNQSGLENFGDERFIKALGKMVEFYAEDIKVDAQGLKNVRSTIVRQLVNRARFERDLELHPEILDEDVSDPIIILGLARSGTTKTHRMMGVDPNLLKTYMWQLVNPAPFPDAKPGEADPRIAAAYQQEQLLPANDQNPELRAGHVYGALEVQEDLWLFGLTFNDNYYSSARPQSSSYYRYTFDRTEPSDLDNYTYVASLFKYLQWQQGGRKGRRWLMKHTGHIAFLEPLLKTYPKATLVHIHRDPHVSLPSLIKLATEFTRPNNQGVTSRDLAPHTLDRTSTYINRYLKDRDRLKLDDRIFDVQYEQIRTNPMPVIREIYRGAGHTLTPESEALMVQYELDNEQGKHGAHKYSLEQFGLTDAIIDDHYGDYIRRFIKRL